MYRRFVDAVMYGCSGIESTHFVRAVRHAREIIDEYEQAILDDKDTIIYTICSDYKEEDASFFESQEWQYAVKYLKSKHLYCKLEYTQRRNTHQWNLSVSALPFSSS